MEPRSRYRRPARRAARPDAASARGSIETHHVRTGHPHGRAASRRAALGSLFLFVVAFVSLLTSPATAADGLGSKTLVVYVEAEGGTDAASVRALVRRAIPERFVIVDASDFHAALVARGQKGSVAQQLPDPKERPKLFTRMREAAQNVSADGIVFAVMF